jgi:hypothetical protein
MPNTLKFFLFFFYLCVAYGQTEVENDSQNAQTRTHEDHKRQIEENMDAIQSDSQKAMEELQKAMGPEDMAALQKAMQEGDQAKIQELTTKLTKKMATGQGGAGMEKMVELSLKGFRERSPGELRAELQERIDGSLIAPIVKQFPKLLDLVVNLFQDPVALPKLFTIPKDRKKLLIFLGVNIALFIAAKVYKRIKKGEGALTRWLLFFSLRMAVLFGFFHKELIPSLQVVKRTFF